MGGSKFAKNQQHKIEFFRRVFNSEAHEIIRASNMHLGEMLQKVWQHRQKGEDLFTCQSWADLKKMMNEKLKKDEKKAAADLKKAAELEKAKKSK